MTDRLHYLAAHDMRSQVQFHVTDARHARLWASRAVVWGNRPIAVRGDVLPVIECADPDAWIDAQIAARCEAIAAKASLYLAVAA